MSESNIIPIEQKQVDFYDDQVVAVRLEDGRVFVPVRPICDLLGIAWQPQARKLKTDPILSELAMSVTIRLQTSANSRRPGKTNMIALPLDSLNGWLFGISANRVKLEIKAHLLQYQRECYHVLDAAFRQQKVTAATDAVIEEILKTDSPAAQAYKMVMAMAQMARQQLLHEAEIKTNAQAIVTNTSRISLIEAQLGDHDRFIDNKQASRISQAVKAIALEMGKRSGRNEFGGVYGELYRRFEIAGYRELPAARFAEAGKFLADWYQTITDSDLPF